MLEKIFSINTTVFKILSNKLRSPTSPEYAAADICHPFITGYKDLNEFYIHFDKYCKTH